MIPKEVIDEIMTTARIEEVIGEFVQLKRSGSNLKGLSPFSKEKTPSFMVSPAKGIFKDFSSGKGGNVVSFLMEHEAMSYPEALRWLADKYNIEIEEEEITPEQLAQRNERETLFLINKFAQEHFENNLWENEKGRAIGLSYFRERGFTEDTIRNFHLGYCLEDGNHVFEQATKAGYQAAHLVKLGLAKENDKGHFDFFRGRVMFPIHNLTGRVVGFGGRTLRKDKKTAKYFNSPESEIYNKSNILYGLYQAKTGLIREDNCFLVEGYTDVISLCQSGIDNVVSSSGTALTEQQIQLIHRYTKNITILFDGDAAGIKASFRGIDMILQQGMNVRIVLFPDGEDPDSYAQQHDEEALRQFLSESAQDFITFKTELLLGEAENDPIKKAELIKQIVQSIALIPDQITRSVYIQACSERFEMDEESLMFEMNKIRKKRFNDTVKGEQRLPEEPPPVKITKQGRELDVSVYHQEKDLIRLMLNYGADKVKLSWEEDRTTVEQEVSVAEYIIEQVQMDSLSLNQGVFADIFEIFVDELKGGNVPGAEFFYAHNHPEISSTAVDLCSSPYELSENWWNMHNLVTKLEEEMLLESVHRALYSFKMKKLDDLIQQSQNQLKDAHDDETMIGLLADQRRMIQARKQLAGMMERIIIK